MTHTSSSTTNGASLEDCHTNVFVLSELNGLKWRRYGPCGSNGICSDITDDPVLCAYAKCLSQGHLCVWRRSVSQMAGVHCPRLDLRLSTEKELWLFWYSEEPDSSLFPNLSKLEDGKWDGPMGVNYEVRTLLFKALHNLIERCLLNKDYVRLGKWFVQPLDNQTSTHRENKSVLAFSFTFFLHGENNVCVSVDVQSQPPVYRLDKSLLSQPKLPVVLVPWCLSGVLSGEECGENDSAANKIFREWSNFYPLPEVDNTENMGYIDPLEEQRLTATKLPKMVDVIVGGVRMKYPSCYVLTVGNDADVASPNGSPRKSSCMGAAASTVLSPPTSPETGCHGGSGHRKRRKVTSEDQWTTARPPSALNLGSQIVSRSSQDSMICKKQTDPLTPEEMLGVWDLRDNSQNQKISCGCPKSSAKAQPSVATKAQLKFGLPPSGKFKAGLRPGRSSFPFHRRSPATFTSNDSSGGGLLLGTPTVSMSDGQPNNFFCGPTTSTASCTGGAEDLGHIGRDRLNHPYFGGGAAHMTVPTSNPLSVVPPPLFSPGLPQAQQQQQQNSLMNPSEPMVQMISPVSQPIGGQMAFGSSESGGNGGYNGPFGHMASSGRFPAPTATQLNNYGINNHSSGRNFAPPQRHPSHLDVGHHPVLDQQTFTDLGLRSQLKLSLNQPSNSRGGSVAADDRRLIVRPALTGAEVRKIDQAMVARVPNLSGNSFNDDDIDSVELYAISVEQTLCWARSNKQLASAHHPVHYRSAYLSAVANNLPSGSEEMTMEISRIEGQPRPEDQFAQRPMPSGTEEALVLIDGRNLEKQLDSQFLPESLRHLLDDSSGQHGDSVSQQRSMTAGGGGPPVVCDPNIISARNKYSIEPDLPDELLESGGDSDKDEFPTVALTPPSSTERVDEPRTIYSKSNKSYSALIKQEPNGPPSAGAIMKEINQIYLTPPSIEPQEPTSTAFSPVSETSASTFEVKSVLQPPNSHMDVSHHHHSASGKLSLYHSYNPSHSEDLSGSVDVKQSEIIFTKPISAVFCSSVDFAPLVADRCGSAWEPLVLQSSKMSSAPQYKPSQVWHSSLRTSNVGRVPTVTQNSVVPSSSSQVAAGGNTSWMTSVLDLPPPSVEKPIPSVGSSRGPEPSPINPSSVYSMHRTPRTPGMADLQSPASNASSCLRNVSSVDNMASMGLSPEANSLVVNVLLCDTFVNVFRDPSFDSCSICACEMSINGPDMGLYVPQNSMEAHLPTSKCSCGFSAIRNRYLSYRNGLFYEDEFEATGQWQGRRIPKDDPSLQFSTAFVELVRVQCLAFHSLCSLFVNKENKENSVAFMLRELEYKDFMELSNVALEQGCQVMDCTIPSKADFERSKMSLVNRWGFLGATHNTDDFEVLALLSKLLPSLQDCLVKSRGQWEAKHKVDGPLSWRSFHRRCFHRHSSAHTEELCQPEPIPSIILANDRDWITISPFALRFWEKLMLEPYSQTRDVAYIVVVPDVAEIVMIIKSYFRELSKVYENCHLGRHCPITKVLRDGLMRVGKSRAKFHLQDNSEVDDWFNQVEKTSPFGGKLKLYAQVCRHQAVFAFDHFDYNIFRDNQSTYKENQTPPVGAPPGSMPPPPPPDNSAGDCGPDKGDSGDVHNPVEENLLQPPVFVVYMINPFTFGPDVPNGGEMERLATEGLLRCYMEMITNSTLADNVKANAQLQIISLESIMEGVCNETSSAIAKELKVDWDSGNVEPFHGNNWLANDGSLSNNQLHHMKSIALSVYAQSRSVSLQSFLSMQAKTLTGFGPSAAHTELIRRQQQYFNAYRVFCPPFILGRDQEADRVDGGYGTSGSLVGPAGLSSSVHEQSNVLFVSYCLSEDQRWILVTCTDLVGEMLETAVINIIVYDRRSCQKKAVIKEAIEMRVWEFVKGILATSTRPWRIVICRLGRLGCDELRCWARLLEKHQLRQTSRALKTNCGQCSLISSLQEIPCISSACLVSLEPEASLRIFPKSFLPAVRSCTLSTPEDASCTHILVFPTSAIPQITTPDSIAHVTKASVENDDNLFGIDNLDNMDGMDFLDILNDPDHRENETTGYDECLPQQPLACGYYASTAPVGPLPSWFWSGCPSAKFRTPVILKSALLIHTAAVQQNDESLLHQQRTGHPLDSQQTTDVLKFVLESFNALSWLNIDMGTGDRRSCLPVHIQALLRLYQTSASLL